MRRDEIPIQYWIWTTFSLSISFILCFRFVIILCLVYSRQSRGYSESNSLPRRCARKIEFGCTPQCVKHFTSSEGSIISSREISSAGLVGLR